MGVVPSAVRLGDGDMTIENVVIIAKGLMVELDFDMKKLDDNAAFLARVLEEGQQVYGVTTGYGDSCVVQTPPLLHDDLAANLVRSLGCGMGDTFSVEETRAILAVRLASLKRGYSGVTSCIIKFIALLLNIGITPIIPQEGSVGASGDLAPLSYLAAVLMGERHVLCNLEIRPTAEVFKERNLKPLKLSPKGALAVLNGTSVMTALACLNYQRAGYLVKMCTRVTALVCVGLLGNKGHFDKDLMNLKAHKGITEIASWLRSDLNMDDKFEMQGHRRIQDRYSLRCAPHVIGAVKESLDWIENIIKVELNSVNDNPVFDTENNKVLHGGHFYGGHITMAMDTLKTGIANLADLLDRQMAQLVDCKFNNGLPRNLTGSTGQRMAVNNGFKGVQISVSAWTAEALKHTMPTSVFSRSTECHNQDKVSLGTIAARDCRKVLELTEQVVVASVLMSVQAVHIRRQQNELDGKWGMPNKKLLEFCDDVLEHFDFLVEDRALESDMRRFLGYLRAECWKFYPKLVDME